MTAADDAKVAAGEAHRIGPGCIVLIAGPSGAGKDTLIGGARAHFHSNADFFFPRRIVTREASASEDNDSLTAAHFDCARLDGEFALWWEAHGHKYAIPAVIDDHIRAGHTVICNVSRTVIGQARMKYQRAFYVLITAPPEVLAARIAQRQRGSDGKSVDRINRVSDAGVAPDFMIDNVGAPETGTCELIDIIRRCGHP